MLDIRLTFSTIIFIFPFSMNVEPCSLSNQISRRPLEKARPEIYLQIKNLQDMLGIKS